jgi:hypothetical protein
MKYTHLNGYTCARSIKEEHMAASIINEKKPFLVHSDTKMICG